MEKRADARVICVKYMKINQHIEKYLDYYCDFEKNLPFAVLLKGKWGCGKTYFVKDYISKKKKKTILHISLYGVDSFAGIKEKIIIELLPFVSEKHSNVASKILRNIKRIPKIRDWIPPDIDELLVDIFLKKAKECVFVFDDIERCDIEIDKLFGYINNFVEFKNQKVILIANEEEILKSDEKEKYRKIKEKLIGKEFFVNANIKKAINEFLGNIRDKELKQHFDKIKELLFKIFNQSKYDNLRLMHQALFEFEYFFKSFSSKAQKDTELFEKMFYEFVVIFIEYKKGSIKSDDFFKKYPQFFKGSSKENEQSKHFLDKYDNVSYWLTCFEVDILGKILQGISLSEIDKKSIIDKLENLAGINKESWRELWDYYERSDKEFFKNLKEVKEKWKEKRYNDFFVVLHTYGIFLKLAENGMFEKDKKDIFKEGKEYIEFLIKEKKFPLNLREQNRGFGWKEAAYGLGYSGIKNKEWRELIEFINKKLEDLKGVFIREKITNELMPILRGEKDSGQNLDLLINYNFLHNKGNKEAYFQYFDVNEITKIIITNDSIFLSDLQKTFKERYKNMATEIEGIEQEIPFLKKLNIKLNGEIKKIEKKFGDNITPTSYRLRRFVDESIQPFIKK